VIATSTQVDIKSVDKELVKKISDDKYFAREKGEKKKGEDAFFKQGEKPEVRRHTLMGSEYRS
jgi:large subunit ribosomal protein L6e